jgi:hypothetical protein
MCLHFNHESTCSLQHSRSHPLDDRCYNVCIWITRERGPRATPYPSGHPIKGGLTVAQIEQVGLQGDGLIADIVSRDARGVCKRTNVAEETGKLRRRCVRAGRTGGLRDGRVGLGGRVSKLALLVATVGRLLACFCGGHGKDSKILVVRFRPICAERGGRWLCAAGPARFMQNGAERGGSWP